MPAEREVSLPFAPPSPDTGSRLVGREADAALRQRAASIIDRHAEEIAARWESQLPTPLPNATDYATGSSQASAIMEVVHSLAASLAGDGEAPDSEPSALAIGAAAYGGGVTVAELLRAFQLLESMCLALLEGAVADGVLASAGVTDGMRLCRDLREVFASMTQAAVQGHAQAADAAMQERFRRLRHDLRNPLSTIRSALELMADESIPEDARRSPRFRGMIERNASTLDQMVVSRLSDAEARVMPSSIVRAGNGGAPASGSRGHGEPRDDVGGARQGEDRQSGSF